MDVTNRVDTWWNIGKFPVLYVDLGRFKSFDTHVQGSPDFIPMVRREYYSHDLPRDPCK